MIQVLESARDWWQFATLTPMVSIIGVYPCPIEFWITLRNFLSQFLPPLYITITPPSTTTVGSSW